MASVIMNLYKGQRIDITAQMKDADAILGVFRNHDIRFDKKFTTINGKGPSTITFKGLHAKNYHSDITKMIVSLYEMSCDDKIGNVYVKITGYNKFQKNKSQESEKETNEVNTSENDIAEDDTL